MATADSYGLFWNSDSGDRKYNADSFERWLRKFFTSGVFEGDLQVLASSGMTVNVQTGYCNLFGKVGLFEVVNSITLDAANSRYPRIDTIVVERNDTDRIISLKKVNGSYSGENPQPTAPIWDETQGVYQLVLAQIYIGAGVSAITQSNITDTRTDSNLCGYITGTVEEIDFAQITAQFEQYFAEFEQSNLEEFETWFEHMKDQLDTDAAGHLQSEIDGLDDRLSDAESDIESKAPTNHASSTSTYGLGTTTNYGHVKTINALTQSSHSDGTALSAYQGYLLDQKVKNKVLYLTGVACAATTGNFVNLSNSAITANHVLAECVFANPSAITTDVTWTTASGNVKINGKCASATTCSLVLVKKDN